ncbi:MAG: lipoate--protein ligase family protein [Planctomycetes bacterium]|nr:lipoate--protein ligase family protein [Planctomycetota bacterium]
MTKTAGRLIVDGALPGAVNMGRDEALLELQGVPTLRFYRWLNPTLSLGYFQRASDLDIDAARQRGCDVVRRSTGGKAILHEHELTYSLCAPEVGALSGGPAAAMTAIHDALAGELSSQSKADVFIRHQSVLQSDVKDSAWCFEDSSPLDICLDGKKLLGSAARRKNNWILFHGSLVLNTPRETPHIAALGFEPNIKQCVTALSSALGIDFVDGNWHPDELLLGEQIAADKYATEEFLHKR